ncbi:EVE domain-containing protein [Zooshikella ganghwensis]|uniref:EVE domain-containing protein n=1 Tax=Zooshikella ganghwensis TaxID=202772 RepID=A0A4P9VHR8_9GAMM|nr:EVE domain-containing protein [Zooshikella ganghwensis]RDH42046.1 EVE domain-containing protein [Zooshikella ganghwensis]
MAIKTRYWLMKSEPDVFSIDDLFDTPNQTEAWDGVRNYQARNMMRDEMQLGDLVFFYHSSCKPPGIVGIAEISKTAYPDHTAWDPGSPYYDPKSSSENPRWFMVDVKFYKKYPRMITLEELKQQPELNEMPLLKRGSRLSIMPVTQNQWEIINKLAE